MQTYSIHFNNHYILPAQANGSIKGYHMLKYEGVKSVTEVPYFEGDHWPDALEDFLKVERKAGRKSKRSEESLERVQNESLLAKVKSYLKKEQKV